MIEPIKRFRIGKALLLSISQLQMQFGIASGDSQTALENEPQPQQTSPLRRASCKLAQLPYIKETTLGVECVHTTHSCSSPLPQRQMVLRAFGYAARPKFFDTLADDYLVKSP